MLHFEIAVIAVLTAISCALPGTLLVLRGAALMSDAISHSVLLGIALMFLHVQRLDGFIDLLVLTNALHPVKSLKICGNKLRVLSESLKLLPSLKIFDVMNNQIIKRNHQL